jgi:hypothetical protein
MGRMIIKKGSVWIVVFTSTESVVYLSLATYLCSVFLQIEVMGFIIVSHQ